MHFADCLRNIATNKDRDSFADVFNYYAPRLKSYMVRLGAAEAEAEEIVQDVMVTVWLKADQFDKSRAAATTWIYRLARNRSIDLHRRTHRPKLDLDDPIFQPDPALTPDVQLEQRQQDKRVRAELTKLPPEQTNLIRDAFYLGLAHADIAQKNHLPLGTVKSRLRLAYAKLKRALADS